MQDDVGLPRTTVQKSIKELMPKEMRIAGDASELLVQCCNQFVHLVSTQANDISEREKRSTISPEHVVKALEELEFGPQYLEAVKAGVLRAAWSGGWAAVAAHPAGTLYGCPLAPSAPLLPSPVLDSVPGPSGTLACGAAWEDWKLDNKEHREHKAGHKKGDSGLTQEQLIELQQKLFEEARAATLSGPLPSMVIEQAAAPLAAQQQQQQPDQQPEPEQQQQPPVQPGGGEAAAAADAAAEGAGGDELDGDDLDVDSELVEG